jgi:hypothetical protein
MLTVLFDVQGSNRQKVSKLVVIYTPLTLFAKAQLCRKFRTLVRSMTWTLTDFGCTNSMHAVTHKGS